MSAPPIPGLGVYTASEGDVLRNGIYLAMPVCARLLAAYEADPNEWARHQAKALRAAIRQARAYHKEDAA